MNFRLNSLILILGLALCNTNLPAQYLKEKRIIIGTWLSQNAEQKLIFRRNGRGVQYFSGGGHIKWNYSFTNKIADCDFSRSGIAEDSTFYLHLKDTKFGYADCYVVNSLDSSELSISPFGKGGVILFSKQKQKKGN